MFIFLSKTLVTGQSGKRQLPQHFFWTLMWKCGTQQLLIDQYHGILTRLQQRVWFDSVLFSSLLFPSS